MSTPVSFSSLGLSEAMLRAITAAGFLQPTPIQALAIPAVLRGGDLRASAQTGSGKTAAFAVPILDHLSAGRQEIPRSVRVLVLVPTRELAAQVGKFFRECGSNLAMRIKTNIVFGGVSINLQMMDLRGGADVVVGTPGRLLDLVSKNALKLSTVETLVLDEADRLLNLGFAEELAQVLELLPAKRQNLMFSATFPADVQILADRLLKNPEVIDVKSAPATAPDILQRAIEVDPPRRAQLLIHLMREEKWARVLVFVATKYATEHIADKIRRAGIHAQALHGELSQGTRTKTLEDFKASKIQVLVATDLAARGLDIELLPAVVNFDLPRSTTDYPHRIGRTGRAGASGVAVSFITADSHEHFRLIEKRHKLQILREQIPGFEPVLVEPTEPSAEAPGPSLL